MLRINDRIAISTDEFLWEFSTSAGPGGQNVNKVNSRAVLRWEPARSAGLPGPVRERLLQQLAGRLTSRGELLVSSQRTRDRSRNIDDCLEKLRQLVLDAATPPRPRRPTRPTRASQVRRVESKLRRSDAKRLRRRPEAD